MTRRKSVQELVKPLRKLSILSSSTTDKSPTTPEKLHELQTSQKHEQNDIISWLPSELGLYIFSMLSFPDLVQAQLTCRIWCRIVRDPSIWKARYYNLHKRFPDLYYHKQPQLPTLSQLPQEETEQQPQRQRPMDDIREEEEDKNYDEVDKNQQTKDEEEEKDEDDEMSWQTKYCRAQTHANWRMGIVQRKQLISDHNKSRILSVKLKKNYLITLTETNVIGLYFVR
ncbi:hypothetical protein BDA99DRAFT_40863 [Phascolomyces articulosus]|uniref:F-box domain-containing protein n=1 Tax=Phascolomyces articulosus TaxID=60185 RepID=A0AAD5PEK7_9FUNG|nr:hypothetical protein BDA99DRAFT_40863 [Phascolomyces articulosus]